MRRQIVFAAAADSSRAAANGFTPAAPKLCNRPPKCNRIVGNDIARAVLPTVRGAIMLGPRCLARSGLLEVLPATPCSCRIPIVCESMVAHARQIRTSLSTFVAGSWILHSLVRQATLNLSCVLSIAELMLMFAMT